MQVSSLRFSVGLGSLLAVLILGSVYAAFIPLGDDNALNDELPPPDIASETQLHCVALAIYFEGGSTSESEEGQRHIARVVVERAKANLRKWGGSDLCDVVFYKKAGARQFTFACLPLARRTPRPGKAWDQALAYRDRRARGPQQHPRRQHPLLHESGADVGPQCVPLQEGVRAGAGGRAPSLLPRRPARLSARTCAAATRSNASVTKRRCKPRNELPRRRPNARSGWRC